MKKLVFIAGLLALFQTAPITQDVQNPNAPRPNTVSFSGKVVGERSNENLAGATVHIQGSTHEVITDKKGVFTFITAQKFPLTLTVSHVGYATQDIAIPDP